MRTSLSFAGAFALALFALPASAGATPSDGLDDDLLDRQLQQLYDAADHSVTAEVRLGDDVWSEAMGARKIDGSGGRVDEDDRVRIASLTKSMVSAVLLRLQSEGEVDLDATIGDYLPGLLPYEDEPTIRQIMQHTGGLRDYFSYLYPSLAESDMGDFYANYRNDYEPEELIAMSTADPLLFEPGTGYAYSNTGYMALGLLIEHVTGEELREVLDERVFGPADLDDTYLPKDGTWGIRGANPVPYMTTGEADEPYFDSTRLSHDQMWAAGGVISTMEDVNDFYDALLDGTLLDGAELAQMTDFVGGGDQGLAYGLGLVGLQPGCPDDPEEVFVGHTGGGLGHMTYSFHSLDGDRQATFTWNVDDRHTMADPAELNWALASLLTAGLCGTDAGAMPTGAEALAQALTAVPGSEAPLVLN
ncbi:serine hydrolase domain-containing protein [Glycomyces mayteni]|uniref:Serine hydrolase domain-containing protein n=1 Tax=Glycomyces mayteni TaxID=543887 RepID=A0ABW2DDZ8_9ACTN